MSLLRSFTGTSTWWKQVLAAVLIIIIWLYLWYFPWQAELHHIFWLQLGIGLVIFIAPGFCVYGLLSDHTDFKFNHITFGFVISHLILAFLGTAARFFHFSFETLIFLIMALGLILILIFILPRMDRITLFRMDRERSAYILAIIPILFMSLLVSFIVIQRVLSDDDLTYLAYVTNWQYSTHLDFHDLIFDKPQLVSPRFWLMSAPFAQAFLAEISKMPGILILGGYYEPFLVVLSALCWYELAIALKFSPRGASASVILQWTFLLLFSEYLHPGGPYFTQLSADKATAAFILAPVFFQSLIKLLDAPTGHNRILVLLTGLTLTLMHPIILAYAVFIGGLLILLKEDSQGWRHKIVPMAILVIILLPQIAIRFAKVPGLEAVSFDPQVIINQSGSDKLVTRWENTRFYAYNHNILSMKIPYAENIPLPESVLKWIWILIPIFAFVVALKKWSYGAAPQFLIACFALCFLAGFPLTGWIIGYFLHARMLARSVWLFPFGISAVYLVLAIVNKFWVKSNTQSDRLQASSWQLIAITVFSIAVFLLYLRENNLPNFEKFSLKSIRYQGLSTAGQRLDQLISDNPVVIGSPNVNDLIPGVSWKSQLVTFRISEPSNMFYFTSVERDTRISDMQRIFASSTLAMDKMFLLRKYNVGFLLLQRGDLKLFNDLIAMYPQMFTVTEIGGFYIVQFSEQ